MRAAALMLVVLLQAAPAAAQVLPCEATRTGPVGEVIAVAEGRERYMSWDIEPKDGEGLETTHFSRPGLLVDFELVDGVFEVIGVLVTVTRHQDGAGRRAPSAFETRAVFGGETLSWSQRDFAESEDELARRLKARWPDKLDLTVVIDGKDVAAAMFDLSKRAVAERMAREALGECVAASG